MTSETNHQRHMVKATQVHVFEFLNINRKKFKLVSLQYSPDEWDGMGAAMLENWHCGRLRAGVKWTPTQYNSKGCYAKYRDLNPYLVHVSQSVHTIQTILQCPCPKLTWTKCRTTLDTDTFVKSLWMAQIGLCHIIESYLKFVYRPRPFSSWRYPHP